MIYYQSIDPRVIQPILFDIFEEQRLEEFGDRLPREDEVISIAVYDKDRVIGGVVANINYYEMEVKYLGVYETYRGLKIGSRLLDQVEKMAWERGITTVTLTTQGYQARGFYEKHGYQLFGQLDDVPRPNDVRYYMCKQFNE